MSRLAMPQSVPEVGGRRSGRPTARTGAAALMLGALGIVFGDIGTSPLYAMQSIFEVNGVHPDQTGVFGMISLVVWAIIFVVTVKYVGFVMRADNHHEGGIMALVALVQGASVKGRAARATLIGLGILGVALFLGDGMITPAISVISSVEGLGSTSLGLKSLVIPITLGLLTGLFVGQQLGTKRIGRLFGPAMAVWFVLLAVSGLAKVLEHPAILEALSPSYGLLFFVDRPTVGFVALGAVVLVITGSEALYADLGHFDRPSISRAWLFVVLPALLLNYLGQGALILHSPKAAGNPFFALFPQWAQIPMVVVAVAATMIASQAVITGAYSVTRQAMQMGFLPRLRIRHTSGSEGQIYVPAVNWVLFAGVVGVVIGFGSSTAMASAYGIAVTGTFATTTILFFVVVRILWHKSLRVVVPGAVAFLTLDLLFFSANLTKVVSGGWFPLAVGLIIFTLLTTWQRGREIVTDKRSRAEGLLSDFVDEVHAAHPPVHRVPGTAICPTPGRTTPLALRANVDVNHVMHEDVIIVSVDTGTVPHVEPADRVEVEDLGDREDGIAYLTIHYGFLDDIDVPAALQGARGRGLRSDIDLDAATYFVSEITIVRSDDPEMRSWRKRLFLLLARASTSPVDSFHLPEDRIVTMGAHVDL